MTRRQGHSESMWLHTIKIASPTLSILTADVRQEDDDNDDGDDHHDADDTEANDDKDNDDVDAQIRHDYK